MKRPLPVEHPAYFEQYISLVKGENIIRVLEEQTIGVQAMLSEVPEEKENYSYAPGKWTLKEVIGHIIDTERIFGYRALRFARGDKNTLPGFDQNEYVKNADFNKRSLYELGHEFGSVRGANLALFKSFDETALDRKGIADGKEMSVRAYIYTIAGHAAHHINVIRTKYIAD